MLLMAVKSRSYPIGESLEATRSELCGCGASGCPAGSDGRGFIKCMLLTNMHQPKRRRSILEHDVPEL